MAVKAVLPVNPERDNFWTHMLAPRKAGESFGTVSRTAALLRVMAEHGEITLKEMSSIVGLAPSTCHHLLDLLRREGLCERLPDRRGYRIGSELFRIAAQVHAKHDIRTLADKFLHEVVAACDETCLLGIYLPIDRKMMFASKVEFQPGVALCTDDERAVVGVMGGQRPLHTGAPSEARG